MSGLRVKAVVLFLASVTAALPQNQIILQGPQVNDPCVALAGLKWVSPAEARSCFTSFPVDPVEKTNVCIFHTIINERANQASQIIDVVYKTLDSFHISTNYQIKAPPPFDQDIHEDILRDLILINSTTYDSDFDLHVDVSRAVKRLNDGHVAYINLCYDGRKLILLSYFTSSTS